MSIPIMPAHPAPTRRPDWRARPAVGRPRGAAGFTLIEIIGVLAVVTILATVVFATTIKQMSLAADQQESTNLVRFATALQNSITRNRYIPGATDWASAIATELGADAGTVLTNYCGSVRVLLMDPNLNLNGSSALPYTQTANGSTNPPAARLMILSSLGPPLPAALTNGTPAATDFNALWNTADGTVPAVPMWAGWKGSGDDLRVQRVNLTPLFVHLLLANYASTNQGQFTIDASASNAVGSAGVNAYFLQNTTLTLLTGTSVPVSTQVLTRDTSYVYVQGIWRGSIFQGPAVTGPVLGLTAAQFAASLGNPLAGGSPLATPTSVVNAFSSYMNSYLAWANAGFPSSGTLPTAVNTASSQMQQTMANLISNFGQGRGD